MGLITQRFPGKKKLPQSKNAFSSKNNTVSMRLYYIFHFFCGKHFFFFLGKRQRTRIDFLPSFCVIFFCCFRKFNATDDVLIFAAKA